ncbi:hypothetical protein B0H11DRAFT_2133580 [Mycena galericulata]|nr:hypothetical protein B0H11DRAFT_2133580 [Mycena galericulata]
MNRPSTLHQRMEAMTDLAGLLFVSDDVIVACLRERFMSDIIAPTSASALAALNPHIISR